MKASQVIDTELKRNRPAEPGKEIVLSATTNGVSVRVHLQDWDRLAVSFTGLTVKAVAVDLPEDQDVFTKRCHQLANRLNYLEEPLRVIEIDEAKGIGIIRSYPPRSGFNAKSFFEVVLNRNEKKISLVRRVRFGSSSKDMFEKIVIGHHLLARLINDLCENVAPVENGG